MLHTYRRKKNGKFYRRKVTEEHISLISEPGSKYMGHFAPKTGTAHCISAAILKFAKEKDISLNSLDAVGCDGTVLNTGTKGGIIRLLEESLQRPLHWFICMLHANELPLRHLLADIDGKTNGPHGFTGPIGTKLKHCETLPIVSFAPIVASIDSITMEELSTDQRYLYEIHQAVSQGKISEALAMRSPGNLNHSRWLTTANRILRLYVATENPSDNLLCLAYFVMTVYAPMWLKIKTNPHVQTGAKHISETLKLVKKQNIRIQSIVMPVIERNAYFIHPENLLLLMIGDEKPYIRELGWRRIKTARAMVSSPNVRHFNMPKLNPDCNNYSEIINWEETTITEPPMTMKFSDNDLEDFIVNKKLFDTEKYPLHTQAVERVIKVVSEASSKVCSHEAREGFILTRLASRERMSSFESKKDYVPK